MIEGNKPSAVARDVYDLNYSRILGYGTVHDVADITMHYGNRGEKVRQLQEKLIYLGYLDPQYENGTYGNQTLDAVRAFQASAGLSATGFANRVTQQQPDEACLIKYEADPSTWTVTDDD